MLVQDELVPEEGILMKNFDRIIVEKEEFIFVYVLNHLNGRKLTEIV